MTSENVFLNAALSYAKRGWLVFPCWGLNESGGCACGSDACSSCKHPHQLAKGGLDAGTTNETTIRNWWARVPDANVAIRTGPESGLVVVDWDGPEGIELSDNTSSELTPRVTTGSGGRHWFFAYPDYQVRNRAKVVPGLDIRADRGYVIAPPSRHISGGTYRWDDGFSPEDTDPAPIPIDILKMLSREKNPVVNPEVIEAELVGDFQDRKDADEQYVKKARAYVAKIPGATSGAGGHNQTWIVAIRVVHGFGLSFRQAMSVLEEYNKRCSPPWSKYELAHKIESAFKDVRNPETLALMKSAGPDGIVGKELWISQLQQGIVKGRNLPLPILSNAVIFATHDERPACVGKVRLDSFSGRLTAFPDGGEPRGYTNHDLNEMTVWFQESGREMYVGKEVAQDAVEIVAHRTAFHPVREYLNGLAWDGKPRIDTWLIRHAGVKSDRYTKAVSGKWLISAVARVMRPGCRADAMLVLEGAQGVRKSTTLEILGGPWSSSLSNAALHSKDAMEQVQGKWLIEMAELDGMSRSEVTTIKDFLSRTNDFYRPSYGRVSEDHHRQAVFFGTTNDSQYLRDPSGGRRFWPVAVTRVIDTDGIAAERDQIWAESVAKYYAGEQWHLTEEEDELARAEQEERVAVDAWEETIAPWLDGRVLDAGLLAPTFDVSVSEVMKGALEIDPQHQTRGDQIRVGHVLKRLGWERFQAKFGEKRQWRHRKAAATATVAK